MFADDDGGRCGGEAIYSVVEAFVRYCNLLWDDAPNGEGAVFTYYREAYVVPRGKMAKFVRYACNWIAEGMSGYIDDEEEKVAIAEATLRSRYCLAREVFTLTVTWRDHENTLEQFCIPRRGDEAFHGWDADKGEANTKENDK